MPSIHNNTTNNERIIASEERARQLAILEEERARTAEQWELCFADAHKASPLSKCDRYDLAFRKAAHAGSALCVDFLLLAFTIWFAPAPLLKEIQSTLGLSKKELWTSSITSDCTAIFMRIVMGPVCDAYGARIPMALVLIVASIPTACVGLINSATSLAVVRLCIGVAGSSFRDCRYGKWHCRWLGNLGGAWTQLMMGTILFPLFRDYFEDSERAWRVICIIPACFAFIWGCIVPFVTDDAPLGNYTTMRKTGSTDRIFLTTSLRSGATWNTWILYAQYACCFGVELVMNNASVLYYTSEFDLTTEEAATFGFLYGSLNIFARGLGGYISDRLNMVAGMRGRLWLQTGLLFMEGVLIIAFAYTKTLAGAVITMCIFSIFTQAAEGAIYGVVPYITKLYTGSVSGFVGSGGNMGSVVYGFGFRAMPYRDAFAMMGGIVIVSSFLTIFIKIPCHAGMIWGEDNHAVIQQRERFRQQQNAGLSRRNNNQTEDAQDTEVEMGNAPKPTVSDQEDLTEGGYLEVTVDVGGTAASESDKDLSDKPTPANADDAEQGP